MKSCRASATLILIGALIVTTSCDSKRRIREQARLEGDAAGTLQNLLDLYDGIYPNVPVTNAGQVFGISDLTHWHTKHPAFFQLEFLKFGPTAGFSHSVYEKYIAAPPFVTNRSVKRSPVLMNSQPFPVPSGTWARYVIWREGPQYYRTSLIPENEVQDIFRKAGVSVPQPTPMPPPPTPAGSPYPKRSLNDRVIIFFRDVADNVGLGRSLWFPVMIASITVFIGIVFLILWFGFRRRCLTK